MDERQYVLSMVVNMIWVGVLFSLQFEKIDQIILSNLRKYQWYVEEWNWQICDIDDAYQLFEFFKS